MKQLSDSFSIRFSGFCFFSLDPYAQSKYRMNQWLNHGRVTPECGLIWFEWAEQVRRFTIAQGIKIFEEWILQGFFFLFLTVCVKICWINNESISWFLPIIFFFKTPFFTLYPLIVNPLFSFYHEENVWGKFWWDERNALSFSPSLFLFPFSL